ncbi:hypothetical protein [Streptomyces sp. KR80]|uniref:hypothetical protein n=1 Tax=Streptomyces sp. KR80 TaxID=3457426 RepID=UPI003FD17DFC
MRGLTRGRPQHGARRRAAAITAAVLSLGALLTGCGGGGGDDGYVAVGAVGPSAEEAREQAVPPEGEVTLIPLDTSERGNGPGGAGAGSTPGRTPEASGGPDTPQGIDVEGRGGHPGPGGTSDGSTGSGTGGGRPGDGTGGGSGPGHDSGNGPGSGDQGGDPGRPDDQPPPPGPVRPAALSVGSPERAPTDQRWCEKVTLDLHNTGDEPVTSGTVTFGTHIIDSIGIDWATIVSTRKLPVPIVGGQRTEKTWTVCVDAWRVPLGMHIETQDVDVAWK